jgi:glycosyltransferase involved in cell wall biosynthesis
VLFSAVLKLFYGRITGELAGVHVNMAERLSLFRKGIIIAVCHAIGIPVVLHLHAAQLHHFYRKLPWPLQALTRWFFSLADRCVVLGHAAEQFVIEDLRVAADKIDIVINGVPSPSVARRVRQPDAVFRILFLGNLSERKGVSDLLKALALPGFNRQALQVSIAGGGDIAGYQALAKELAVDAFVTFEGWADQNKATELMALADVLVLPSYDEGLPLVILEALAQGVAVVCTPVGEIPSVLTDDENVCFVQAGDIPGIAAGLQRVINDDALRSRLESNGRSIYQRDFSMTRFAGNIAAIHKRFFGVSAQLDNSEISG